MDVERVHELREEAARLEHEAAEISGELVALAGRRGALRERYAAAVERLRRVLAELAEAVDADAPDRPGDGCAWCGEPLPGGATRGGEVCPACAARHGIERVDHLPGLTEEAADALPYGLIQLDREGRVVGYNRAEEAVSGRHRERVLGRSFFREVAPCASVREFEGRFREMVARGEEARESFRYVFRFAERERLVGISLRFDPALERGVVAVVPLDEERVR